MVIRLKRDVYLDNNATTSVDKAVIKKMIKVLQHNFGNPSSLYRNAFDSAIILEDSRRVLAATIGANEHEILFTGCASESNNMVIKSQFEQFYPQKKTIISTAIEHQSIIETLEFLETKGANVIFLNVDENGLVSVDELEKLLQENDVMLVSIMFANNEIGSVQDIKAIAQICKKYSVKCMSDCVQALGKVPVDMKELGVDFATFSAHKIHGPKGIGALYVKEGNDIVPLIHGGHQEMNLRAGTESLHNIAGFAKACEKVNEYVGKRDFIRELSDYFIETLQNMDCDVVIHCRTKTSLANTISVTFKEVNNALLLGFLDLNGIASSAGSACNTQANKPSHVLLAIGLTEDEARSSLRFSLGVDTTKRDIDYTVKILQEFFSGKIPPATMLSPHQVDENMLFSDDVWILDVRYWYDKKLLKSMPHAHEISNFRYKNYISKIPKDKQILVVCQVGFDAPLVALYLRKNGYRRVSFLATGLVAWKLVHPELYKKYAGDNVVSLEEEKK